MDSFIDKKVVENVCYKCTFDHPRFTLVIVLVCLQLLHFHGFTKGQVFETIEAGGNIFNGKIHIQNPSVWVDDISFGGCVDECKFRSSCTGVNYHMFYHLCELDIKSSPRVIPTKEGRIQHWIKTTQEDTVECGTQSCNPGYVCNLQKNTCEIKECSPLSVSNDTVILGNVNAIGANVKMQCKEGFVAQGPATITLTCGTDGVWSPEHLICLQEPKDCDEVKEISKNKATTGIYRIRPDGSSNFLVRCDMETLGGGWTVIQRRVSASDFFQDWTTYQIGFGSVDTNYWLGLQQIHNISTQGQYELRVDMTHPNGTTKYAFYKVFELGDVKSKYELTVDGYEGTAGDSLSHHSGQPFSTRDKDSDSYGGNCAEIYLGAWWYKTCHQSNLNGNYGNEAYGKGLTWVTFSTYYTSLMSVEMKIRRKPPLSDI